MDYQKEYSSETDNYVKFIIYHTIIVFTIVFSLLLAVNNIGSEDIQTKVQTARDDEKISGITDSALVKDDLVRTMYFNDEDNLDTSKKRNYTTAQVDSATKEQKSTIKDIETVYNNAFVFKLSFLGDITVDLRTWMFILPVIFLPSLVYIFILDYKISLLKILAANTNEPIPLTEQYPFIFLRPLFITVQVILIILYIFILDNFFQYTDSDLRSLILQGYTLLFYYTIFYSFYLYRRLNNDTGVNVKPALTSKLDAIVKFTKGILLKLKPLLCLRTGQVLIIVTLFLAMSYDGCKAHKGRALDGYKMIFTSAQWENDGLAYLTPYLYKYLYTLTIVVALLLFILYRRNNRLHAKQLLKIYRQFFIACVFIYTVYFGLYNIWAFDFGIVVTAVLFAIWYFRVYKNGKDDHYFGLKELFLYIVFLLPLIIFAIANIVTEFDNHNGWPFFFGGVWMVITGIVLLTTEENDALLAHQTPPS